MFKNILLFAFALLIIATPSQARIDIVPQKIVIENRDRNGELTILNLYDVKGTFRIEIVNFSQDVNGVYTELATPLDSDFNPQDIVRLSPRQFTLNPQGRQKVRVSLRKPAELPDGEYRFHIKATRLAQDDGADENAKKSVSVKANIGVTIPVIVRHGQTQSTASLHDLNVVSATDTDSNRPELHLNIQREGNASTIGMLEVLWEDESGQAKRIGRITNMNLFTDISNRNVKVPLYEMPSGTGKLHVRYVDTVNKGKIFDEIITTL